MPTKRLFSFLSAFSIILLLMVVVIKYSLDGNAGWQETSAQGLKAKMQTGLTQMYWKWQADGRAEQIQYQPENGHGSFVIPMNAQGRPQISKDINGCLQFLYWFIDEKTLNKTVNVSTTFKEARTNNNNASSDSATCNFQYASNTYIYDLNSGHLSFSQ